jgi:response regulator RpfG family c-di-GMP phosphodiesterase
MTPGREGPGPAGHSTVTVLFVDDEPALLRSIVRALRGAPFQVLAADSAEEALTLMRERHVDVLVSDIDMPGMSGPELVALARREFPATLRMLLTGGTTMTRALAAINEGEVHRFFEKPFDAALFQTTMKALAERIEKLRNDGQVEARATRRRLLDHRIEEDFPGTLDVVRDESGAVVVDALPEDVELLDPPPATGHAAR